MEACLGWRVGEWSTFYLYAELYYQVQIICEDFFGASIVCEGHIINIVDCIEMATLKDMEEGIEWRFFFYNLRQSALIQDGARFY